MRCTRVQDRLMAYHDGELSASASRKIEKHLSACDECARILEDLVMIDKEVSTAGVPEVPGEKDRYWESFTSRTLDRVEEDAATRVPLPETRSRPLFPLDLPRLVPAMSIALVVVVSAGILLKVGRVAPVPEKAVYREKALRQDSGQAEGRGEKVKAQSPGPVVMEKRVEMKERVEARSLEMDDQVGSLEEQAISSPKEERTPQEGPLKTGVPEPEVAEAPPLPTQQNEPVLEAKTGKLASNLSSPVKTTARKKIDLSSQEKDTAGTTVDLISKAPAMADDGLTAPDLDRADETTEAREAETAGLVEPGSSARPESSSLSINQVAPEETQLSALAKKDVPPAPDSAPEPVVAGVSAPETEKGTAEQFVEKEAEVAATEDLLAEDDGELTEESAPAEAAPQVTEPVAPPPPSPGPVPVPEPEPAPLTVLASQLPPAKEAFGEVTVKETQPYPYREPAEQLEHALRLAEVRKYWESEQILKDLISRKPPSPVFEEASVLMVDVLTHQNRDREAWQFLDSAKKQFPANDLVQQYKLGTPVLVQ